MFKFNDQQRELYHKRIRRVKRWLRPLPRRATIHNYPVLKWVADTARKKSFLWSFKRDAMIAAIYAGCILTFLPVYGIQIPLAFALALIFRANLMVLVALQLISNPLTILPIWMANYYVGEFFLSIFSFDAKELHDEGMRALQEGGGATFSENVRNSIISIFLGGAILGYFTGFILSLVYQLIAKRYTVHRTQPEFLRPVDPVDREDGSIPFPKDNPNDSGRSSA